MKKSILTTLTGAVMLVAAGMLVHYQWPQQEKSALNAELEQNPYMALLDEEQKQELRQQYLQSRAEATDVAEKQNASEPSDVAEEIPEMSPELKSYIANAQPEKIMEFFAQARKERAEKIQTIMQDEGEDLEWKDELLQYFTLSETLVPQMKGMTLVNADCRESVCALEVDYGQYITSYKEIEPYMSNIGNLIGLDAWVHHDALPHGGVIYFARENATLPELRKI